MAIATRPRGMAREPGPSRGRPSRRVWIAFAAIALLAAALRVPFMWAGVGADEGGYAFIAHEWAGGAHLYRDLFVDRPQGLIVLYRGLTDIGYHAWAIRLGAVLAGTLLTLLVGAIGWMLRSRSAGIAAAAIFAVAGVAPRLEGAGRRRLDADAARSCAASRGGVAARDGEGRGPREAPRHCRIRDREDGGCGHASDRPCGCGRGETRALLEREEQRDRARRERKADEPAADRRSEAAAHERRDRDERRGQDELQREDHMRSTARVSRSISALSRRPSVMHVSSAFAIARR